MSIFQYSEAFAQQLDKEDPIFHFREEFLFPETNGERRNKTDDQTVQPPRP